MITEKGIFEHLVLVHPAGLEIEWCLEALQCRLFCLIIVLIITVILSRRLLQLLYVLSTVFIDLIVVIIQLACGRDSASLETSRYMA